MYLRIFVLFLLFSSLSCAGPSPASFEGLAPDFVLVDQNATSSSSGQALSPRDYLGDVSVWYFGHSS